MVALGTFGSGRGQAHRATIGEHETLKKALENPGSLQFRAESIAVTHTPIFGNPGNTLGSSTFGQITSTAVSANGVNTGGGNRVIHLALNLSF